MKREAGIARREETMKDKGKSLKVGGEEARMTGDKGRPLAIAAISRLTIKFRMRAVSTFERTWLH
jgi:hypothetical protein